MKEQEVNLPELVADFKTKLGLTQTNLADNMGITQSWLNNTILKKRAAPKVSFLIKLIEASGNKPIILLKKGDTLNLNRLHKPENINIQSMETMLDCLGIGIILVMDNGDRYKLKA